MQIVYHYFKEFEKNYGFLFNKKADIYEEFKRLGLYMNWNEKKFDSKRKKFLKNFLCSKKNFISFFENFYGFNIQKSKEPNEEFERLAQHMKWNGYDYSMHKILFLKVFHNLKSQSPKKMPQQNDLKNNLKNEFQFENFAKKFSSKFKKEEIFEERKRDEKKENDKNNDDDAKNDKKKDYDMNSFTSIKKYFTYFKTIYNFQFQIKENAFINFEKLANFMKWSKKYHNEFKKFKLFKKKGEQLEYFKEFFFFETGWKLDQDLTFDENFEKMSEFLGWKTYKKKMNDFNDLVAKLVEDHFGDEKLEIMQRIIEKYKLINIIPEEFKECAIILERSLFVNIYDFVAKNDRKFPDLQSLRKYELENQLDFPLIKSKNSLCYRVLLRRDWEHNKESEQNKKLQLIKKNENELIYNKKEKGNEFSLNPRNLLENSESSHVFEFQELTKEMDWEQIYDTLNIRKFHEIQETDEIKQLIYDFERNENRKIKDANFDFKNKDKFI